MEINQELKRYVEDIIFLCYRKNDLEDICYVIDRSLKFASSQDNT